jgi:hypothetical protein
MGQSAAGERNDSPSMAAIRHFACWTRHSKNPLDRVEPADRPYSTLFFAESNSRFIPFRNSDRNRRDGSTAVFLLVVSK